MKQVLKLSVIFLLFLWTFSGCKKDDTTPDNPKNMVSAGKEIVYFKIVNPAVTGVIDTVHKTITVAVPSGTVLTNLTTDISIAAGHTITPASGATQNFTSPVVYTVTRPDKTTTTWTVTVGNSDVTVTGNIDSSVTWTSDKTYYITGAVYINNNSVLTIQPGTVIKFSTGASLNIGSNDNATVIANGTAANPIVFTSTALSPEAGAWDGLYFDEHTLNNTVLSYCKIQYAGSNSSYGALNIDGCDISVNHCSISNSGSFGVWTHYTNNYGGFKDFSNNTINNTAKYGIAIHAQKLGTIGSGNVFTNVPGVSVTGNYQSGTQQTWKNIGVPYVIDSEIDIDGALTLEPGSVFRFEANGKLEIGYNDQTTFIADGTSSAPITFTSNSTSPVSGSWKGIIFYENTQTNSKMNYCIIDYAGSIKSDGSLYMDGKSSINFTNNTIRNGGGYGIVLEDNAGFQSFTGNTINTCADHIILISSKHVPDLGTPNTFTAAAGKGILVSGNAQYTTDVVWKKQSADFYISDGENDLDGNITFEAGSKFYFIDNSYFYFGYYGNTKLTASGTSTSRITFTSASSSPVAGSWKGFYFDTYTQTNSTLNYCDFLYTGMSDKPAIYTNKSFNVSNTNISNFASSNAAEYDSGIAVPPGTGNNFTWTAD